MTLPEITTVGIAARQEMEDSSVLTHLLACLKDSGKKIFLFPHAEKFLKDFPEARSSEELNGAHLDLLIVLGGDGTILRAVQRLHSLETYLLGINLGHLGFLSEIQPIHLEKTCARVWEADFTLDERMLLAIELRRKDGAIKKYRALNEVVISQAAVARLVELPTKIDGHFLTIFRADGLIVATPTGSTAYSLSAGGPIIHPRLEAMILTPIAPFSLTQKPLVIPAEKTVEVEVDEKNKEALVMTIDGQQNEELASGDRIFISEFPEKVKFLRFPEENYFKTLTEKLKWGERL